MRPSPAALCYRCQRLWIRVSPRNLPLLYARSQTVLPSMRRARSPGNRLRAVSLRARLPSKDPQTAVRTRNQLVDEQALSSCKKSRFQSADDFYGSKGSTGACRALALGNKLAGRSVRRVLRSHSFGHRFQHSTEIAVGREDRRRVLFKRSAHDIEAAQKRIEFLLVRRAKSCGVNRRGFGVRFAFNLKGVLCGIRTDRGHVAFLLPTNVRRFAASLGTESRGYLVSLARHALDNLLRHRRIVFAAFETFVEQFDPKVSDLLTRALGDLFLDFAAPIFDIGNCGGQNRARLLQFLVAHRFPPFGYANDFDQIMCGDCSAGFAAENVVEARERAPLVVEPIVVEHRIADSPPGKTIDDNVELVFGWTFDGRPVPGEDAFVEPLQLIDDWQLHLQPGRGDSANDLAETRDDHRLILRHDEEQRSPFQCGQYEKNAQNRHERVLQKTDHSSHGSGSRGYIDHIHGELLDSPGICSGKVWRMFFRLSSMMIFFCSLGRMACIASR